MYVARSCCKGAGMCNDEKSLTPNSALAIFFHNLIRSDRWKHPAFVPDPGWDAWRAIDIG